MLWPVDTREEPSILADIRQGVGIVSLNRPDRLNAWTPAMGTAYFDLLDAMASDPDVRAILLTGRGRAFCAGADMAGLQAITSVGAMTDKREPRGYWYPMRIGKPLVAAIQGHCIGVGLQQALCCDIRFAAEDAKLAANYARRGINGELGITWLLPRIIGVSDAMDMLLSGRTVGGAEAREMGLVNRLCPADELFDQAFAYCVSLAESCSPWAMRTIKQQLYNDLMTALPAAFEQSEHFLQEAMAGPDMAEAVNAFRDKRPANFAPLSPDLASLGHWPGA